MKERWAFSVDTEKGSFSVGKEHAAPEMIRKQGDLSLLHAFYSQQLSSLFPLKERKGKDDSCTIPQLSLEAVLV